MSGNFTNLLANDLINHTLGVAAYTAPTTYLALSSTTPLVNGTGVTEPTIGTNGYARVAASGSGVWNSASGGATSNFAVINFNTATGSWASGVNMTYACIYDAPTGGNFLGFAPLSVPQPVLTGNTLSIPIGGATVTLS